MKVKRRCYLLKYVAARGEIRGQPHPLTLYGQDATSSSRGMAKMNLIMHSIFEAFPNHDDTLARSLHKEDGSLTNFGRMIANPPFS